MHKRTNYTTNTIMQYHKRKTSQTTTAHDVLHNDPNHNQKHALPRHNYITETRLKMLCPIVDRDRFFSATTTPRQQTPQCMLGPWHLRRLSRSDVSYVHIIDMHHYELILPLQPLQPSLEFPRLQHLHLRQEQAPTTTIIVLLLRCVFVSYISSFAENKYHIYNLSLPEHPHHPDRQRDIHHTSVVPVHWDPPCP